MELLNLDEVAQVNRFVMFDGEKYEIHQASLGELIIELQQAKERSKLDPTEDNLFEDLLNQAVLLLPTCPIEKLKTLKMKQLKALIDFARESDEKAVEGGEGKSVRPSTVIE